MTIDNALENDFVTSLSLDTLWIGLNDISQEGVYVWASGSTAAYRRWSSGQPNNEGGQNCVHMTSSTNWNDFSCKSTYAYVCEKGQRFWGGNI